jgi:poly-gamma-glutamate capsule biosynthesis protein CapA/YwtB (metallophosphatase superfamily)
VIVASIHWGGNWGYRTRDEETRFAPITILLYPFDAA